MPDSVERWFADGWEFTSGTLVRGVESYEGLFTGTSLLATDRLMISDKATELIGEMPSYVWDPKATERGEESPVKENDDFCDALRYAVNSSQPDWRDAIPVFSLHSDEPEEEETSS
mgnify:CR=1 FL=1